LPTFTRSLSIFAVAALLAVALFAAIQAAPASIAETPWLDMWLQVALVVFVAFLLLLLLVRLPDALRAEVAVAALALFMLALVALPLKNTDYPLGGTGGNDLRLYIPYVNQLGAHAAYVDAFYRGLPAFCPPLYYWLVGVGARLAGVPGYHALQTGYFAVVFLLPFLTFWLWRRLAGLWAGVGAAFALLLFLDWFKNPKAPELLSLLLFIPWWLIWVENAPQARMGTRRGRVIWWIAGALLGGLIFQLYYYWFFIGGVALLLNWVAVWWLRRRSPEAGAAADAVGVQARGAIAVLAGAALASAIYWLPFLLSMARSGNFTTLQNRWLAEDKIPLPFPFFDNSLEGLLLAGGLLLLVAGAALRDRRAHGLLRLVLAVYLWAAIGYAGMLAGTPLLTFRAYPIVDYVLALAAAAGLVALWQWSLPARLGERVLRVWRPLGAAILLACMVYLAQEAVYDYLGQEMLAQARDAAPPAAQLAALDALTGGEYVDRVALLGTDYADLLAYRPWNLFVSWVAHYSHPAAGFYDRLGFVQKLAATADTGLFAAALAANRYDTVDALLLFPDGPRWQFRVRDDNFPERTTNRTFQFDDSLLAAPAFERRQEGDLTLHVPIPGAALAFPAPGQVTDLPLADQARLYALARTFAPDLPAGWPEQNDETLRALETALADADLSALPLPALVDYARAAAGDLAAAARAELDARFTAPLNVTLNTQAGQPALRLDGYILEAGEEGAPPHFWLFYTPLIAFDRDYTIWLHLYGSGDAGETKLVFDHPPHTPARLWSPDAPLHDRYPLDAEAGSYRVEFGFWNAEEDVRLVPPDGSPGVVLDGVTLPE
jgi:hypothetical protein